MPLNEINRRDFLRSLGLVTTSLGLAAAWDSCAPKQASGQDENEGELFFKISLAEWSFHRALQSGKMDHLDFPVKASKDFGISAVEYVNQFFMDKAKDLVYLAELKKRCSDNGVVSVLIMCDDEGSMADLDAKKRTQAIENHYKWVDAAKFLGCHSIRVNCHGVGTREEVAAAGADGLRRLSEYGKTAGINVIVENHGGYSSDSHWLAGVIAAVNLPNCGTLPDFGNFCTIKGKDDICKEWYDRYKGVEEMMPFAKGVSAKSLDFDTKGNCLETDYSRMLPIVKRAGYKGYIGIEYEGEQMSEEGGIKATLKLLKKLGSTA